MTNTWHIDTDEALTILDQPGACLLSYDDGMLPYLFDGKRTRPLSMMAFTDLLRRNLITEVTSATDAYGRTAHRYERSDRLDTVATEQATELLHQAAATIDPQHKQWCIVEALRVLGEDVDEYDGSVRL